MNTIGFDNLLWFMGVIENIDKSTGRVQVRCFGVHPTVAQDPEFDLPWATPINGTYGNMNFIPQIAEWVFGFFIDGRDAQQPMIIGTIPGANATLPYGSGDIAENHYVKPSRESIEKFGTPPLHPAMSGEDVTETPILIAEVTKRTSLATPDGSTVNEPDPVIGGDASYVSVISPGYARSYVSVSGSEDAEHVSIMHTSGAHIQIDNSGNIKIKSMGDTYSGSEGNSGEYVEGRKDLIIDGKYTISVNGGDCVMKIAGDLVIDAMNDVKYNVSGKMNFNVSESITMTGSKINIHARENNIDFYAAKKVKMFAGGDLAIRSNGSMFVNSDNMNFDTGQFRVKSADTSITGAGKVAFDGGIFYVGAGASFIEGNPNFNSGSGAGQADAVVSTTDIATPVVQFDIKSRALVAESGRQDSVSSTATAGRGHNALDDVVDVSGDTSPILVAYSGFNESEVLRNVAVGRAGALLELIGDAESGGDYNIIFSGTKISLPQPITTFTIQEMLAWQTDSVSAGSESSAAGKYQVIKKTLNGVVNKLDGLSLTDLYNENTQDTIGYFLLENRGLSKYIAGSLSRETFANNLSKEWAALPIVSGPKAGQSFYEGVGSNKARVSVSAILSAIDQIDIGGGIIV
ncbi:MAG: hypothetical protein COA84_13115 [Robiginitomaculum sp.]|nr:MAG: hypothetical protein COA84_13115 [Robiginitomaculum sp.]